MGQVNYNLSFSVWVVKVQWSVTIAWHTAADHAPSALDEMKSKFL